MAKITEEQRKGFIQGYESGARKARAYLELADRKLYDKYKRALQNLIFENCSNDEEAYFFSSLGKILNRISPQPGGESFFNMANAVAPNKREAISLVENEYQILSELEDLLNQAETENINITFHDFCKSLAREFCSKPIDLEKCKWVDFMLKGEEEQEVDQQQLNLFGKERELEDILKTFSKKASQEKSSICKSIIENDDILLDQMILLFPTMVGLCSMVTKEDTYQDMNTILIYYLTVLSRRVQKVPSQNKRYGLSCITGFLCNSLLRYPNGISIHLDSSLFENMGILEGRNAFSSRKATNLFSNKIGIIEVREANGMLFGVSRQTNAFMENPIYKSWILKSPKLSSAEMRIMPSKFLEAEIPKVELNESIIMSDFHQSYHQNPDVGIMGFMCHEITKTEPEESKNAKPSLPSFRKSSIPHLVFADSDGKIEIKESEDNGVARFGNKDYCFQYCRKSDGAEEISQQNLQQLVKSDQQPRDLYKALKKLVNSSGKFRRDCSVEFLTTWIIGTYFFRLFSSFPRVILSEDPGVESKIVLSNLSKVAFNGIAFSDDDREIKNLYQLINNHCPSLFIFAEPGQRHTKKAMFDLLASRPTIKGEKSIKSGKTQSKDCPVMFGTYQTDLEGVIPNERCLIVPVTRARPKSLLEQDQHSWTMAELKILSLRNFTRVKSIYRDMVEKDEYPMDLTPMITVAQFLQISGVRGLVDKIQAFIDFENAKRTTDIESSPEKNLIVGLLDKDELWSNSEETLQLAGSSLTRMAKANSPSHKRAKITSNWIKNFFDRSGLNYEYLKSKKNHLSNRTEKSSIYGFSVSKNELKDFCERMKLNLE